MRGLCVALWVCVGCGSGGGNGGGGGGGGGGSGSTTFSNGGAGGTGRSSISRERSLPEQRLLHSMYRPPGQHEMIVAARLIGFVAAHHHRQRAGLGAGGSAGDWRVEKVRTPGFELFGAQVEWSRRLGGAPVYVNAADADWVMRPDPVIALWSDTLQLTPSLTVVGAGALDVSVRLESSSGEATLLGFACRVGAGRSGS